MQKLRFFWVWPVALAGAMLLGPTDARALTSEEEAKLLPTDGAAQDGFGSGVAIDGDSALIGAFNDNDNGSLSGSAYVFVRTAGVWTEQAKLIASDGVGSGDFGYSVALDGDTALIGAREVDEHTGAAYVFTRTGNVWTEQAKLQASDGENFARFGWSVALDGDTALIGAISDHGAGPWSGSAYVFVRTAGTWTEQFKIQSDDLAEGDVFGQSVAIDGDIAVIGAPGDDDFGTSSGSTYLFERVSEYWISLGKLLPTNSAEEDGFGSGVAIDGDTLVIGASKKGSAYVFHRSQALVWTQQAELLPSDGHLDWFGESLAVVGDTALIGARGNWYIDDWGAAYVFTRTGDVWTEQAKLQASDGEANVEFGWSVALDGDAAIIGAWRDNDNGYGSGSAYVFRLGEGGDGGDGGDGGVPASSSPSALLMILVLLGSSTYFLRR